MYGKRKRRHATPHPRIPRLVQRRIVLYFVIMKGGNVEKPSLSNSVLCRIKAALLDCALNGPFVLLPRLCIPLPSAFPLFQGPDFILTL